MTLSELRKKITAGQPTIGSWLQLPSPDAAEIMAQAGFDWITIDMEHGSVGIDKLPDIVRAIQCGGSLPFARLPEARRVWIKAALEAGCLGLVFPMIETAEELMRAIQLATYPGQDFWTHGKKPDLPYRGVGFCRANAYGRYFDHYLAKLAPEIFIVAQIEHIRAVNNLHAILAHPRLDAIMVGPYDLSGSMGLTGKFNDALFVETMSRIYEACRKYNICMGLHIVEPDPEKLEMEISKGCQFIAYGIDTVFLWQSAAKALQEICK